MNLVAEGYNSFDTKKTPSGVVKYLPDPKSVIALIKSGKLKEHILLVQGGTTTFLAPALSMGAIGIITMSGAPDISSRNSVARISDALRHDRLSPEERNSVCNGR